MNALKPRVPKCSCHQRIFISKLGNLIKILLKVVLDLIRGKDAATAMGIIKNTPKSASEYLEKLLKSAVANAENNFGMDASKLYVSECFVMK